jgi:bifunctional DNA-binding transcriptional regulator/antitoxin component of YhaV-PrlF toxin-antitoxin module
MKLKLTSKRQATFPVEVCEELGLKPGDHLTLERSAKEDGWVLRPEEKVEEPVSWYGTLRSYAKGKKTSMASVRASIAEGRSRNPGK